MTGLDLASPLDPRAIPETHYSVLGVGPTAAPEQIQKAYERCVKEIRAESLAAYSLISAEDVERQLQRVSHAYMMLINLHTRNEYDQELLTKAANTPEPTPTEIDPEMPPREPEQSEKVVFLHASNRFLRKKVSAKPAPLELESPPVDQSDSDSVFAGRVHQRRSIYQQLNAKLNSSRERVQVYLENREAEGQPAQFDGATLHDIRNLSEVTLEELTAVTCVQQLYLEALESENYDAFPSEVYLKGYLSSYLRALELPEDRVMVEYLHRYRAREKRR